MSNQIIGKVSGFTYSSVQAELETKATKDYVDVQDALKADKDYVDGQDALKADKATTYLRTEIDAKDVLKADKSNTYTKAQVDSKDALKADKTYTDAQLALKADKTYTDEQLALKADSGEIESARGTEPTLGARLDATDAQLAEKALKTEVGTLASLLTTAKTSIVNAINELFNSKANKAQEAWITPTLLNGWTGDVKYRKDNFGIVHFKGTLTPGTGTAFQIPSQYTPSQTLTFSVPNNGVLLKGSARCVIEMPSRNVWFREIDTTHWFDISGITYFAEV